jgi:hypothetical protein
MRDDKSRDHSLRPEWLLDQDPLLLPALTERHELESLARRMVAANAIRRYREDRDNGRVSYSRRKHWYAEHQSRSYWPKWFTYSFTIKAVTQLEGAGLLIHDQKKPGNRHWQSWFRATPELVNPKGKLQYIPTRRIFLRDEQKNDIDYNDNARLVVQMRRDIDLINAFLAKQTVTFDDKPLKEGDPLHINLHCVSGAIRLTTRRIFHDSSFDLGGRWYTDLQNIPREARPRLKLNGHALAIHDYSALYPKLLYAMVGEIPDGDPYTIPDWPRQVSKPILNILINAKNGTSALRAAVTELKQRRIGKGQSERYAAAKEIIAALKKRNAPIARFFHSDAGKRLMWYEAFLLRDNMLEAMKREIPFVPLHDALMVPTGSLRELVIIMETNLAALRVSLGVQFKRQKARISAVQI